VTRVRRHTRKTASGKTATVRQHERDTGDGMRPVPEGMTPPPMVGQGKPTPAQPAQAQEWWAEDEVEHEGHTFKVNRAPAYQPQGDYDFADPKADKKAAAARYKAAKEALAAYHTDTEDDEYLRLNHEVGEAAKDIPWWRRG